MFLFTYGSLMLSEVMYALLQEPLESEPAELQGYSRWIISGKPYPGIVQDPEGKVQGRLYFGLSLEAQKLLDAFEDEMYERKLLTVKLSSGLECEAKAYVIPNSLRSCLGLKPWDAEEFHRLHLESYLKTCTKFRESFLRSCH